MEVVEITPGLHRWRAPHPDWKPDEGWDELVGSVFYELERVLVSHGEPVLSDGRAGLAHAIERARVEQPA